MTEIESEIERIIDKRTSSAENKAEIFKAEMETLKTENDQLKKKCKELDDFDKSQSKKLLLEIAEKDQQIKSLQIELDLKKDAMESLAQQYETLSENTAHELKLLNDKLKELEQELNE